MRTALAMQESNALHPFSLAAWSVAALRRTGRLVAVGLRRAIITTGTAAAARTFRSRCALIGPGGVHARRGSSAPVLCRCRCGFGMTRRAALFPGQAHAEQFFDVAQISHFL